MCLQVLAGSHLPDWRFRGLFEEFGEICVETDYGEEEDVEGGGEEVGNLAEGAG